jgi:hypothetical protein
MMGPGKLTLLFLPLQAGSSILEEEEDLKWHCFGLERVVFQFR